jgi:hypothetical protein
VPRGDRSRCSGASRAERAALAVLQSVDIGKARAESITAQARLDLAKKTFERPRATLRGALPNVPFAGAANAILLPESITAERLARVIAGFQGSLTRPH